MLDSRDHPRAWVVVSLATVGGIIGTVAGAAIAFFRQGGLIGDPEYLNLLLDNVWALTASALGGGLGWFGGTVTGWYSARQASPPTPVTAWILRGLAVSVVAAAFFVLLWVPAIPYPTSVDDIDLGYDVAPLRTLIYLNTALAVGTLLALSRRTTAPRGAVTTGGIIAVVILIAAAVTFGSVPTIDRAWLQRWLSMQKDTAAFAPNLIDPAPRSCPDLVGHGLNLEPRSIADEVPFVHFWLDDRTPRWLPQGFGLLTEHSWSPPPRGLWGDDQCREVLLVLWRVAGKADPIWDVPPGGVVNEWVAVPADWCESGSATEQCLEYRAQVDSPPGGHPRLVLILRTIGIDPDEADRIARGIPLGDHDH